MSVTNDFSLPRFLVNTTLSAVFVQKVMTTKATKESSLPTKITKCLFALGLSNAALDKTAGVMPIPFAIGGTLLAGKVLGSTKSLPATIVAGVTSPIAFAAGGLATEAAVDNPAGFLEGVFRTLGSIANLFSSQAAIFSVVFNRAKEA